MKATFDVTAAEESSTDRKLTPNGDKTLINQLKIFSVSGGPSAMQDLERSDESYQTPLTLHEIGKPTGRSVSPELG
jgi:hypothetical protein